jgi:hypothetical protein
MKIQDGESICGGLDPISFMALIHGQTLLFRRGEGENLIVAEVTVEEGLFEEAKCRVKVRKIVNNGSESKVALGNILTATLAELTKV